MTKDQFDQLLYVLNRINSNLERLWYGGLSEPSGTEAVTCSLMRSTSSTHGAFSGKSVADAIDGVTEVLSTIDSNLASIAESAEMVSDALEKKLGAGE